MIGSVLLEFLAAVICPFPYKIGETQSWLGRAPVTALLLAANLASFIAMNSASHWQPVPPLLYLKYGLDPGHVTVAALFTYTLVHIGWAHLIWNMAFLSLFAPPVEEKVGSGLMAVVYIVGGVAAALMHVMIVQHFEGNSSILDMPLVGASGAISAVIGIFATNGAFRPIRLFWTGGALFGKSWTFLEVPAGTGVILWLVSTIYGAIISLEHPQTGGISYFSHLGGFIFGFVCGRLAGFRNRRRAESMSSETRQIQPEVRPASMDVTALLQRSLHEGDYEKAWPLYLKCRTIGAKIPAVDLLRLADLAVANGYQENAASVRKLAGECSTT